VDIAQRAMDERWNTHGRSLVLVKSADGRRTAFCDHHHLREVLLEIGDIIDAVDDIVMVPIHGSTGQRPYR